VLHGIDLDVADGEFVVFVGPSGCGKSTLLRSIAGLESITGGTIAIDGADVTGLPASERGLAMVFQSYALYPHMSVYANMAFALEDRWLQGDEIDKRVKRAAGILRLTDYLDRKPKALSGGQRQRVAIGRAIVRDPEGLPVRRAALQPRCGAARRDPHRDCRKLKERCRSRHDDLRHPRPGRGDDAGRPHRRAQGRQASSRSARRWSSTLSLDAASDIVAERPMLMPA
jgi:ABC-type uncharacterized transport system YnjBCD ATPase subunit